MGCIFEIFIEFICEVIFEGMASIFLYFGRSIFPQKKLSPRAETVIRVISAIISIVMFILLIAGVILLLEGVFENIPYLKKLGWTFIGIAVGFVIIGLIFKTIKSIR